MSHSGNRTPYEDRNAQRKAYNEEDDRRVLCKGLIYIHQTEKALLVQEGEGLAGDNWKKEGKKTWFPKSAVSCAPYLLSLNPGDEVELTMSKRLAVEKEMMYE